MGGVDKCDTINTSNRVSIGSLEVNSSSLPEKAKS